jgi:hypothetical protein
VESLRGGDGTSQQIHLRYISTRLHEEILGRAPETLVFLTAVASVALSCNTGIQTGGPCTQRDKLVIPVRQMNKVTPRQPFTVHTRCATRSASTRAAEFS